MKELIDSVINSKEEKTIKIYGYIFKTVLDYIDEFDFDCHSSECYDGQVEMLFWSTKMKKYYNLSYNIFKENYITFSYFSD